MNRIFIFVIFVSIVLSNNFTSLLDKADSLYKLQDFNKSCSLYQEVLPQISDTLPLEKIDINNKLAISYYFMSDINNAVLYFENALEIAVEIDNKELISNNLGNIGSMKIGMGDFEGGMHYHKKALNMAEEIPNQGLILKHLSNIGLAYMSSNQLDSAETYMVRVLEKGDSKTTLYNLGGLYCMQNRYEEALDLSFRALDIAKENNQIKSIADLYGNIGLIYTNIADYHRADSFLTRAYEMAKKLNDRSGMKERASNLGKLHFHKNEFSIALEYMEESIRLSEELGDISSQSRALTNIAGFYLEIGEYEIAKQKWEKALKLIISINDSLNLGLVYTNYAIYYSRLENYDKARELLLQALDIHRNIGQMSLVGSDLINLASIYDKDNDLDKAIEYSKKALKISAELHHKQEEASRLSTLGNYYRKAGDYDKALIYLREAEELGRKLMDNNRQNYTFTALALLYRDMDEKILALEYFDSSFAASERLREKFTSSKHKISYFSQNADFYTVAFNLTYQIYMDKKEEKPAQFGDSLLNKAFSYLESSRSRALLEQIAEAKELIRKEVPDSLLREKGFIYERMSYLIDKINDTETEGMKVLEYEKELREIEAKLELVNSKIKKSSPKYAKLNYPELIDIKTVQKELLDAESALLEYVVADSFGYLFCITTETCQIYEVPGYIKTGPPIEMLLGFIEKPGQSISKFKTVSFGLYENLIKPAEDLIADKERLIISGDGVLNNLPFDVLIDEISGSNWADVPYLIKKKAISYTPSATVLYQNMKSPKQSDALGFVAFADPLYDKELDSVITEDLVLRSAFEDSTREGINRLKYSSEEAIEIEKSFNDHSRIFLREEANEANVKNKNLASYRYVHFACHGIYNNENPNYSGLILSRDIENNGFLQMYEIYDLDLNADMVVLSSCRSAMGKEKSGEGMIGLSRAFMYAGAKTVLASLWQINDRSTAKFMSNFYKDLKEDNKSKALQKTKINFLKIEPNPFYWASFKLTGQE